MSVNRPHALSIAGFDPSGGAGVLADCKTFASHKVQGMAIITANTIQTESHLKEVQWQNLDFVRESLSALMKCYLFKAIKIGIVPHADFLNAIIRRIKTIDPAAFIIWDPVLKSSSGHVFFQLESLKKNACLWHQIDLITPNAEEFDVLKPFIPEDFRKAFLVKGGHRRKQQGLDILKTKKRELFFLPGEQKMYPKHGSGCVLSSAIAAHIALGKPLEEACQLAKIDIERYLSSTSTLLGTHDLH